MKLTFKKTLIACVLPLLLTACDSGDSESTSADNIALQKAAKAPKTVLEGTWTDVEIDKLDISNTRTCTNTESFTGLRLIRSRDCLATNGDKSHVSFSGIFSVGTKTQDGTEINETFKTVSGYWTKKHKRHDVGNDSLYDVEKPELGKLINGKVELGLFKIEHNVITFAFDKYEYRSDGAEGKSIRPVSIFDYSYKLNRKQ